MSYRKYYWKQFLKQAEVAWILLWNGVIRDRGHHSNWRKK